MFIQLTLSYSGRHILINKHRIVTIQPDDDGGSIVTTSLDVDGSYYAISEDYEYIKHELQS